MFRDALPQQQAARRMLLGTAVSAIGRGLTLPFLFIYLTKVRDITPTTAGLVIGWLGLATLLIAPVGGTLVDRLGARRIVLPMLLVEAAGVASLALVTSPLRAFVSATLVAIGGGVIWSAMTTILSSVTSDAERQKVFGLQFALLNLGIGVGATISGTLVDIERPGTFQLIYLVDAACYLIPLGILLSMPTVGRRLVDRPATAKRDEPGYREVFRDRAFVRWLTFAIVLTISGYAQIEVGFTAFAIDVAHVSTQIVGYAFTMNTMVIVVAQLFVIKLIQGRSRTRVLASVGVIMASSWLVLGLAGFVDGGNAVLAAVGVIATGGIFAVGETLLSPVNPTLINALATDELRGRYNALGSMVWGISGIVGPVSAAPLIGAGLGGLWIGLVVGGCLIASVLALSLRRLLTVDQDGRILAPAHVAA
ncbi:MFS family permease [Allocatelliglobosispora scoriae]|uniref:MFS family permease n=1 Tax=Allocatelliglobosispora scoriae TaxID=643052 RepID=A0A841BWG9_9ACTN|nr:MFS transporter [Allocatelliglobosispora scoriae]MBB5871112.1 MFS family permease [Allocatelliglobosispora scoriae]